MAPRVELGKDDEGRTLRQKWDDECDRMGTSFIREEAKFSSRQLSGSSVLSERSRRRDRSAEVESQSLAPDDALDLEEVIFSSRQLSGPSSRQVSGSSVASERSRRRDRSAEVESQSLAPGDALDLEEVIFPSRQLSGPSSRQVSGSSVASERNRRGRGKFSVKRESLAPAAFDPNASPSGAGAGVVEEFRVGFAKLEVDQRKLAEAVEALTSRVDDQNRNLHLRMESALQLRRKQQMLRRSAAASSPDGKGGGGSLPSTHDPAALDPGAGSAPDTPAVELTAPGAFSTPSSTMITPMSTAMVPSSSSSASAGDGQTPSKVVRRSKSVSEKDKRNLMAFLKSKNWIDPDDEENAGSAKNGGVPRWKIFVKSQKFDMLVGILIMVNALVMSLEIEYTGTKIARALDVPGSGWDWPRAEASFLGLEYLFTVLFILELLARLAAFGCGYLLSATNALDALIVMISVLDSFIMGPLDMEMPNVTILRLLRLIKLTKVLRIVRVLKFFHHLRVLGISIVHSVGALGWSMVLLTLVQLIAAILICQVVYDFEMDEEAPKDQRLEVFRAFGSLTSSWLTMFELTLAPGAWAKIGRLLIFEVSPLYIFFFVPYVWGVTFAIVRVISAIFLKETLAAAASDQETAIAEKMKKRDRDINNLRKVFLEADTAGDGHINRSEFERMMNDARVKTWLAVLELEVTECEGLFDLLDSGDGEISFDEFIAGVMRMRGSAKAIDLVTLIYENKKVISALQSVQKHVRTGVGRILESSSECLVPILRSRILQSPVSSSMLRFPISVFNTGRFGLLPKDSSGWGWGLWPL